MQSKSGDPLTRGAPLPDDVDSSDRVTISSAPSSFVSGDGLGPRSGETHKVETHDHAVGQHAMGQHPIGLPLRWLEKLLALSTDLPIEAGEGAVVRAVVSTLSSILPNHAVGACFIPSEGRGAGAQEVIRAIPERAPHAIIGSDPTRIFPGLTYERVAALGTTGSTLHVASGDDDCEDGQSITSALVDRATAIAQRGVILAREHARAVLAASELRAINAQMAQTEKLASLGQIAAGVVHELNNPLTSIVAYTDFLIRKSSMRETPDPDEIDRLRRIAESAGRMLRFTRDLVSYARPSSEVPVKVSVHMVIDQALAFCEHILNEANVKVERRFANAAPQVRGKPEQLAQVFVNLVTNASHAMRAGGGELVITTESCGDQVKIVVADNGHGIAPEHLPNVFAPFFTTKGSGVGTGLGLTIVKSIVDAHEGTIEVVSTSAPPASGAAFTIALPAAPNR